jgi:hypothetical protein
MNTNDIRDGIIATSATSGSVAISFIDAISPYIRFASLLVGLVIGIVILIKHIRNWDKS